MDLPSSSMGYRQKVWTEESMVCHVNSAVVLTTKLFGEPFQATASVSNVPQGHIK